MNNFEKLWDLEQTEARSIGTAWGDKGFGAIGLFLQRPLVNFGYRTTPVNSSSFATTGGDGVHYGFLHLNGGASEDSPVVMTVPCAWKDRANVIVGENLRAFLCLGCEFGFFSLEQLVYNFKDTLTQISNPTTKSPEETQLLLLLRNTFDLKPWADVESKLGLINEQFLPMLRFSSSE